MFKNELMESSNMSYKSYKNAEFIPSSKEKPFSIFNKLEKTAMSLTATSIATLTILENKVTALAGSIDVTDKIESVTSGDSKGGIFAPAVTLAVSVFGDLYSLIAVICGILTVIFFSIAGINIMTSKKSTTRDDNKSWIIYIAGGCAIVFLAGTIASIIASAGSSAGGNTGTPDAPEAPAA